MSSLRYATRQYVTLEYLGVVPALPRRMYTYVLQYVPRYAVACCTWLEAEVRADAAMQVRRRLTFIERTSIRWAQFLATALPRSSSSPPETMLERQQLVEMTRISLLLQRF
jgi:hypothetical protein